MYQKASHNLWPGRAENDITKDTLQIHQVVEFVDLENEQLPQLEENQRGIAFLSFDVDEGVRRNNGRTGAAQGPTVLRKSISSFAVHFENEKKIIDAGVLTCENRNLEKTQKALTASVNTILNSGYFPIILGGGHELAFGHFRGLLKFLLSKHNTPRIGIFNFDAHFDLRDYRYGITSGTGFLQIADLCKNNLTDFNYFVLGLQQANNSRKLFKTAESLDTEYIFARHTKIFDRDNILSRVKNFIDKVDFIYTTICMDVFASSVAPGVSALAINGIQPDIAFEVLDLLLSSKKVIGFDLAELNPHFDADDRTAKLAAAIIYEVLMGI
ncbi:MAG: formimidoylglutamase [Rhodothermaceae bacterium]